MEVHVDAQGNITPSNRRGLFTAVTFDQDNKVTSYSFTCPDCEDRDPGRWPEFTTIGESYSHKC